MFSHYFILKISLINLNDKHKFISINTINFLKVYRYYLLFVYIEIRLEIYLDNNKVLVCFDSGLL